MCMASEGHPSIIQVIYGRDREAFFDHVNEEIAFEHGLCFLLRFVSFTTRPSAQVTWIHKSKSLAERG